MDLSNIVVKITVRPMVKTCKVGGRAAEPTSFGMLCYSHYQKALYDYETTAYEG